MSYVVIGFPQPKIKFGLWESKYDVIDPLYSVIVR